jgi:hypothetical protein
MLHRAAHHCFGWLSLALDLCCRGSYDPCDSSSFVGCSSLAATRSHQLLSRSRSTDAQQSRLVYLWSLWRESSSLTTCPQRHSYYTVLLSADERSNEVCATHWSLLRTWWPCGQWTEFRHRFLPTPWWRLSLFHHRWRPSSKQGLPSHTTVFWRGMGQKSRVRVAPHSGVGMS